MECWWNNTDRVELIYLEKNCPSATLSITNLTMTGQGFNPGLEDERQKTNSLSNGTALKCVANKHNMLFYFMQFHYIPLLYMQQTMLDTICFVF
jgi:hypothetical protein